MGRSVTTMAALQSLTSQFMPVYCTIATRRFMFFNDPHRRGRARISTLLAGDALADFNELHAVREDDPAVGEELVQPRLCAGDVPEIHTWTGT